MSRESQSLHELVLVISRQSGSEPFFLQPGWGHSLPAGRLHEDVLNNELFLKLCPFADDIWLNIIGDPEQLPRKKVRPYYREAGFTAGHQAPRALQSEIRAEGKNDTQMKEVLRHYGLEKFLDRQKGCG
jgi:hypothetical protein